MSAFVIATSTIKDKEKFGEYAKAAAASLSAHGGSIAKRGQFGESLAGANSHHSVAVLEFADMESLNSWFNSSEYQAIIPLRNDACDMNLVSYTVPTN